MSFKHFVVTLAVIAALVSTVLAPTVVMAHGGGTPILTRVEAGPYWIYAFAEPVSPQAGAEYHVSIAVTLPQDKGGETPVTDAEISVEFVAANGETLVRQAESSLSGPGYYEADVVLPAGGTWQVTAIINSPLGTVSASYPLEAREAGMNLGKIGTGAVMVLVGIAAVAYAFFSRKPITKDGSDTENIPEAKA